MLYINGIFKDLYPLPLDKFYDMLYNIVSNLKTINRHIVKTRKNLYYIVPMIIGLVLMVTACENGLVEEIYEPTSVATATDSSTTTPATLADSISFGFNPGFHGEQVSADSFVFTFYVNYKNETKKYIVPTGTAYFKEDSISLAPVVFAGREDGIWGNANGNASMYGGKKCRVDTVYTYGPGQTKIISRFQIREKIIVKLNVSGIEKTAEYNFSYNF